MTCPLCGAEPGKPCVTRGGVVRPEYPHRARRQHWDELHEWCYCPMAGNHRHAPTANCPESAVYPLHNTPSAR